MLKVERYVARGPQLKQRVGRTPNPPMRVVDCLPQVLLVTAQEMDVIIVYYPDIELRN